MKVISHVNERAFEIDVTVDPEREHHFTARLPGGGIS
jgi:hypothetical protein